MTIETLIASTMITVMSLGEIIPGTYYKCGEVGGVYVNSKVYICAIDSEIEFYKYHELGHHFWFAYLKEEQKKEYTELYEKSKKIGIRHFYRSYSMKSVEEDFADNFSVYILERKHKIQMKKRINLIKKYILLQY